MSEKVTKGYKVSPDSKQYVEELFAGSEFSDQGDFLLHIAALYEKQKLRNNEVSGYAAQLDEMDFHTRRITELYLSMIMTEQSGRLRLGEEYAERMSELSDIISGQQDEIRGLSDDLNRATTLTGNLHKQIGELERNVQQLQQANERGEDLISEYKSRIDSFSGLLNRQTEEVNQSKALQQELTELTKLTNNYQEQISRLAEERDRLLAIAAQDKKETEERLAKERKEAAERHLRELTDAKLRAELEADKALVTLRRELQDELATERAGHTAELRKLYADIDALRQQMALATSQQGTPARRQPDDAGM